MLGLVLTATCRSAAGAGAVRRFSGSCATWGRAASVLAKYVAVHDAEFS
jgi:hypothetical protein